VRDVEGGVESQRLFSTTSSTVFFDAVLSTFFT